MFKKTGIFLLAALMLVFSAGMALAEPALDLSQAVPFKEGEQSPIPAIVHSQLNGVSNLTNTADDYDIPQGVYFNNTPVEIIAIVKTLGNYPVELGDENQLWAKVRIGKNEQFGGIIGNMPLINLSADVSLADALPEGTLTQETALQADNGLTDTIIGTYPKDSVVTVLGWFPQLIHVQIDGKAGFVRHEDVTLSQDAAMKMANGQPVGFDEIQPGYQAQHEEYMTELMKLYDKHGDSNHWPLEVAAQASELANKYGYLFSDIVNIMPGKDDLSREEVLIIAQETAKDYFGYENWDSISLAYYYEPADPDAHIWKASLWGTQGTPDVKVWLNQQGEVIGTLNTEEEYLDDTGLYAEEMSPEAALAESRGTLEYYLFGAEATPTDEEITEETAVNKAWEAFQANFNDIKKEDYTTETLFMTDFTEEIRWWLVTFVRQYTPDVSTQYHVVFLSDDEEPAFQTNPAFYRDDIKWAEGMLALNKLENERGPFYTWTLEQKAEWEPEYFGLPQEGDVTLETAIATAREEVKKAFTLTDKDLEQFEIAPYFLISPTRSWQINLLSPDIIPESEGLGFTVVLDAVSGQVEEVFNMGYGD